MKWFCKINLVSFNKNLTCESESETSNVKSETKKF